MPEQITTMPKTPDFVEGIINLRGSMMPIVDQRRRFSLPDIDRSDQERIVVFLVKGVRTGFIDFVSGQRDPNRKYSPLHALPFTHDPFLSHNCCKTLQK